jgi:hypothetical protein
MPLKCIQFLKTDRNNNPTMHTVNCLGAIRPVHYVECFSWKYQDDGCQPVRLLQDPGFTATEASFHALWLRGGDPGADIGRVAAFGLLRDGCPIMGVRGSGGMRNNTATVAFDAPVYADG